MIQKKMVAAMQMGLCCITRRRGQIRGSVCLGFSLGGCEPGHQISRRQVVSCCARAGPIEATTQSVFLQAGQPPFDEYRQRNRLRGKFAVCGDGFDDGRGPVFRRPKGHGSFAGRICRGWEAVPIPDAPDLSVVQPPAPPRRAPPRSRRSRIGDRSRDGAAGFGRSAASYSRLRRGGRSRSGERPRVRGGGLRSTYAIRQVAYPAPRFPSRTDRGQDASHRCRSAAEEGFHRRGGRRGNDGHGHRHRLVERRRGAWSGSQSSSGKDGSS